MSSAFVWIPGDSEVDQLYAKSRSDLVYKSFRNTVLTKTSFVSIRGILNKLQFVFCRTKVIFELKPRAEPWTSVRQPAHLWGTFPGWLCCEGTAFASVSVAF
jgi:hypothetical protein